MLSQARALVRSALPAVLLASGCGGPSAPAPVGTAAVAPRVVAQGEDAGDAGAEGPATIAQADTGELLTPGEGTKLADGTIAVARDDGVEFPALRVDAKVARGEATTVLGRWVVYRDSEGHLRLRALVPRVQAIGKGNVTLELGDRATFGDWEVQWVGVRKRGAAEQRALTFEGTYRKRATSEWGAWPGERASYAVPSSHGLFHFEVSVAEVRGEPSRPGGGVVLSGVEVDRSRTAAFGESLSSGLYVFPDGLRVAFRSKTECEYDSTRPCHAEYGVEAVFERHEAEALLKSKRTSLLGHSFELSGRTLIVRK